MLQAFVEMLVKTASAVSVSVNKGPGQGATVVVVLTVTGLCVVISDVEQAVGLPNVNSGVDTVPRALTDFGDLDAIWSVGRDAR